MKLSEMMLEREFYDGVCMTCGARTGRAAGGYASDGSTHGDGCEWEAAIAKAIEADCGPEAAAAYLRANIDLIHQEANWLNKTRDQPRSRASLDLSALNETFKEMYGKS